MLDPWNVNRYNNKTSQLGYSCEEQGILDKMAWGFYISLELGARDTLFVYFHQE